MMLMVIFITDLSANYFTDYYPCILYVLNVYDIHTIKY